MKREKASFLGPEHGRLYLRWYAPAGPARAAVLICPPFFEERRCAERVMVETARALAQAGAVVAQFDYRGCGESPGRLQDCRLQDWETDLAHTARYLQEQVAKAPLLFWGLRGGASLALRALARGALAQGALLWAPILRGHVYVRDERRLRHLREALAFGRANPTALTTATAPDLVDLNGYPVSRDLLRDLERLALLPWRDPLQSSLRLVRASPGGRVSADDRILEEALRKAGANVETEEWLGVPFWRSLGVVDARPVADRSVAWMVQGTACVASTMDPFPSCR